MTNKRYRIEESLGPDPRLFQRIEFPEPVASGAASDPRIDEIIAMLQEMKRSMDPAMRQSADVVEAYRREIAEVYELRRELDAMKLAITSTKNEIASIYRSENEGKGMRRVAGELDAVVGATEAATSSILSGLEDIETEANMLRAAGVATGNNDHVGAILDRVISMYEACNFQDLTGQRIGKIVSVLKFVEERLDKMIGVWGGLDAFKEFAANNPDLPSIDDEKSLLNGPKLESDAGHVDQNDIDALFG
ncbi:MAG: chemotaxis protein [Salinarimonadaceae bacterium]|nr:MAG: chemotaxis protein [Salinarimonadaceae bacterium]